MASLSKLSPEMLEKVMEVLDHSDTCYIVKYGGQVQYWPIVPEILQPNEKGAELVKIVGPYRKVQSYKKS